MEKLYAITQTDLEDTNPCKTWLFDNKKIAYEFLCNQYQKAWDKACIPNSDLTIDVIEKKSKYPFVDGYKNKDFVVGEYYNIYFKDGTEIVFGMCQITTTRIHTDKPYITNEYFSIVEEDLQEAFYIAEQMIKNPDNVTFGDILWLCRSVGMGKEIINAKEGKWLDVVEEALRKLGYRI